LRKQTVDIIGDIVPTLQATVDIDSVVDNFDGTFTISTECTWWISLNDTITIGGSDYLVTAFVINESITIQGSVIPIADDFALTVPNYIHGTIKMTQNEVDGELNKELVYPLVWLFEIIRDRKNTDDDSMIDRETELRIFFVASANYSDWLTDDHYTNVIDPMQSMVDLFIEKIKENKLFTDVLNYDCIPLVNFSVEGNQDESVFDCNLSGIELRLFAEIRENLSCENKCKCFN
jgi:hypothetical protein